MIAKVSCAALMGIDAFKVELEVDFSRSGMPCFTMVGLAEGAVKESKERVFPALKNCGFKVPPARITVNLAPASGRLLWRPAPVIAPGGHDSLMLAHTNN